MEDTQLVIKETEHKLAAEKSEREFTHKYQWNSCCLRVDKEH